MGGVGRFNDRAGAFFRMSAMVANPMFSEDVESKLSPQKRARFSGTGEGVRGSSKADDWFSVIEEFSDWSELFIGQLPVASSDDHEVGLIEFAGSRYAMLVVRIDVNLVRIHGKKHDTVKAVLLAENLCEHGARLLTSVFLIASDEDNRFAIGRTRFGWKIQAVVGLCHASCMDRKQDGDEVENEVFHGMDILDARCFLQNTRA